MDSVTIDGAVTWHINRIHYYATMFHHEVMRQEPDKALLAHYIESMQSHMRGAANAALSREVVKGA